MIIIDENQVQTYIELRHVYDGWSVAYMKDGSMVNRWDAKENPERYKATQKWIEDQERL